MIDEATQAQFLRYVVVGLVSNALLYAGYLALTRAGAEPKLAMTCLYALGVAQAFVMNKRWSFRHRGRHGPTFVRYCAAYALGYAINFAALALLVDGFGYRHQLVQAVMVVLLALMLFALQKLWIFRQDPLFPGRA